MEFNEDNFNKEVIESNLPVVVFFWKPGCSACANLDQTKEELSKDLDNKAKIGTLNILENPDISKNYKIPAVPTIIIFKNGKAKEKAVGLRPKQVIINRINLL